MDNLNCFIEEIDEIQIYSNPEDLLQPEPEPEKETNAKLWTVNATKLLITLRTEFSEQFLLAKKKGKKAELWEMVASGMGEKGHLFSHKDCDEKWRRLLTQHRKHHDLTKKSGNNAVKWQYYNLMEEAIIPTGKKQSLSPPKELLYESLKSNMLHKVSYQSSPSITSMMPRHSSKLPTIQPISPQLPIPSSKTDTDSSPTTFKGKTPLWFQQYEIMKKEQNNELNKRLDKLETREIEMLNIQKELVDKLNTANEIESQKLDMFKKMFNID